MLDMMDIVIMVVMVFMVVMVVMVVVVISENKMIIIKIKIKEEKNLLILFIFKHLFYKSDRLLTKTQPLISLLII